MRTDSLLRPGPLRTAFVFAGVLAAAALMLMLDANPAASQNQTLFAYQVDKSPGMDPDGDAWKDVTAVQVALNAQPAAYSAGGGSVTAVEARALHHEGKLYIRVEWADATQDADTSRPELFADAVAVEFPAKAKTTIPSICMGQADQGVNIWHWRADSQAGIEAPLTVFSNGFVDDYPGEEDVWYPARAVGNPFARLDAGPVQNLAAYAFGTIGPATAQTVAGSGVYRDGKWAVVFERPLAAGAEDEANFDSGSKTDMAFAVWNGSEGDRNGSKSASQFVTLSLTGALAPGAAGSDARWLMLAAVLLLVFTALGFGLAYVGTRTG